MVHRFKVVDRARLQGLKAMGSKQFLCNLWMTNRRSRVGGIVSHAFPLFFGQHQTPRIPY